MKTTAFAVVVLLSGGAYAAEPATYVCTGGAEHVKGSARQHVLVHGSRPDAWIGVREVGRSMVGASRDFASRLVLRDEELRDTRIDWRD